MKRLFRCVGISSMARALLARSTWLCNLALALAVALSTAGQDGADLEALSRYQDDLKALSLKDLADLRVTTVSKKAQPASQTAAAVHVITREDIRRSGVTSLAEALRLAPGIQVAKVQSHQWAISARGFNDPFANKLLVMIDGRSVYTPLFAGVYWDVQDTLLADVDRIEVVRGPGATMWGANAVNGVINIITKPASETQGIFVTGLAGTEDRGIAGVRYGEKLADNLHMRIFGKYLNRDDSHLATGGDAGDHWWMGRGGFRLDWEPSEENLLTFQGDLYRGGINRLITQPSLSPPYAMTLEDPGTVEGGNLLARLSHEFSSDSDLSFQIYYDGTRRNSVNLVEDRHTMDVDGQHRFALGERQELLWGGGYRFTSDEIGESVGMRFSPDSRVAHLVNAFVQDDITLLPDTLRFALGTKLEHNDYTGFEYQPNARLWWSPHPRHAIWTAVSRAVRTPSRAEHDGRINARVIPPSPGSPLPALVSLISDRDFRSEELVAFEAGYRVRPHERVTFDLASFYNDYDELRTFEQGTPQLESSPVPHAVVPLTVDNQMEGETYGAELSANWQATDWWRLRLQYSYLQMRLHTRSRSADSMAENAEGESPHHVVSAQSGWDLPHHLSFDCVLRYVDRLPAFGIGSYLEWDARLGWRPRSNFELAVGGRNLLDSHHPEFRPTFVNTEFIEVERSAYATFSWQF